MLNILSDGFIETYEGYYISTKAIKRIFIMDSINGTSSWVCLEDFSGETYTVAFSGKRDECANYLDRLFGKIL